jgi:hypothetical protein
VVVDDHRLDLGSPVREPSCGEVRARERNGWSDVVERVVRPDAEVMENRGDSHFFEFDWIASSDGEAQVYNAVHVVPIPDGVGPQQSLVIAENLFDCRQIRYKTRFFEALQHCGELQQ